MNHRKSALGLGTASGRIVRRRSLAAAAWCAFVAASLLAWTGGIHAQPAGEAGAGFVEGEDIGGGAKFAVGGAERWFANHTVDWRAKGAHCKAHLEAARAEENQALAIRPAMLRSSGRALVDQFHAHIEVRDEHLAAFRDCSNEANRNRPDEAERPAYYYGRPDPPVDFAQGVAKGVRDGFDRDRLWYAAGPAAAKVFQKFKLLGGAVAAIGTGTAAADMVRTAQEINPNVDPYDFGRKVGELIYQGADLKDAATHAASAAASLPAGARAGGGAPSAGGNTGGAGGSSSGGRGGAPAVAAEDAPTLPRDPGAGPSARGPPSGDEIGHGSFGTVYESPGDPNVVIKKFDRPDTTPEQLAESFDGQQHGQALIIEANRTPSPPGTDIPMTKIGEVDPLGDPAWMLIENVDGATWQAKNAYVAPKGKAFQGFNDAEKAAVSQLADNMADKGLVWVDPNPGNVFFFNEGKGLRAGVLDHDFIYTADELATVINDKNSLGSTVFENSWPGDRALSRWYLFNFKSNGVVNPHEFMHAIMQRHGYRPEPPP